MNRSPKRMAGFAAALVLGTGAAVARPPMSRQGK